MDKLSIQKISWQIVKLIAHWNLLITLFSVYIFTFNQIEQFKMIFSISETPIQLGPKKKYKVIDAESK